MTPALPQPRPNIFVVGDAKCGTTTLYRMFQLSEGIGTSRTRKELHYFTAPELTARTAGPGDDRIPRSIVHDEATYLAEFAHLPRDLKRIADVSPSYLQEPAAAARIHAFAPDARIVIMLREPAAKIFSQYVHLWGEERETLPFEEAFEKSTERREAGFSTMFDYEAGGRYTEAVERYFMLFGPEQVKVLLFEEMFGPDGSTRRDLEGFLGIRFAIGAPPRMNVGGKVKSHFLASLLDNDPLRNRVKRIFPLPLRTRIGQAIRSTVPMEKPVLNPGTAAALRQRYRESTVGLEGLLRRETGWPAG